MKKFKTSLHIFNPDCFPLAICCCSSKVNGPHPFNALFNQFIRKRNWALNQRTLAKLSKGALEKDLANRLHPICKPRKFLFTKLDEFLVLIFNLNFREFRLHFSFRWFSRKICVTWWWPPIDFYLNGNFVIYWSCNCIGKKKDNIYLPI